MLSSSQYQAGLEKPGHFISSQRLRVCNVSARRTRRFFLATTVQLSYCRIRRGTPDVEEVLAASVVLARALGQIGSCLCSWSKRLHHFGCTLSSRRSAVARTICFGTVQEAPKSAARRRTDQAAALLRAAFSSPLFAPRMAGRSRLLPDGHVEAFMAAPRSLPGLFISSTSKNKTNHCSSLSILEGSFSTLSKPILQTFVESLRCVKMRISQNSSSKYFDLL